MPVIRTEYNDRGEAFKNFDAEDSETCREWDDAGRLVKVIENHTGSSPGSDTDRTSEFEYDGNGNVTKRTEINPDTGNQETRYVYGVGANSDLHSNSLLHAVIYPDSTDPADPFSGTDNVRFEYNRQGQITQKTDQAGTVHEYVYDKLGREIEDRASSLGSGIDSSVRRIEHTYNAKGELEKVTSYDNATVGSGVVLDQIEYTYDKFQQPLKYRQEHDGPVGAGTPEVAYTYADGSNNDKRTLSVIYPDLREIDFDYGASGSDDDLLSRFGGLGDAGGSLVKYTYFGVDTFCEQEYPENAVKLTYIDSNATGDPYTGLDRFGRVIDQRWQKGTTNLERLEYTYSRLGNRTERKNTEGSHQDEKYTYDGLYRLDDMKRGTLDNGSITDKKFAQDWGYDALGNWDTFKQDDDGTGWDLNQTRDHTKANEIEKIDNDANVMSHDPAGNITKSPRPGNWTASYDYVWDAWNRLVEVTGRGTNVVFAYNGEHKRITKTADGITRHFYYSLDWQILEERLDEETEPLRQYVWNPNPDSMDDLILRDEGVQGSGSSSSGGLERLYALNDLMNVTAITDDDGSVQERYGYDPFGESRVMDASFNSRTSSNYDWEFRYKTYLEDLESGLYQVRFRYLHPGLGRWMSRDPVEYGGGLNLYAFIGSNPVDYRDSLGLLPEECCRDCDSEERAFDAALEHYKWLKNHGRECRRLARALAQAKAWRKEQCGKMKEYLDLAEVPCEVCLFKNAIACGICYTLIGYYLAYSKSCKKAHADEERYQARYNQMCSNTTTPTTEDLIEAGRRVHELMNAYLDCVDERNACLAE